MSEKKVVCHGGKCEYKDNDIHECNDCTEAEEIEHELLKENV